MGNQSGQATMEFLIVSIVLMIVIVVLGLLLDRTSAGMFVVHAARSASHALSDNTAGTVGDVLLY